ncbi:hypothetical protein Moror_17674 [Moniliophthora roreri MCA 2997]|uniref:F-box domain-containing protein n=2 Tax=Moniliophthora roreri TaxID=221103 RepID=V2XY84_MONRO|nr:hypothetical protein Moror_17674 [Moniliophthora roreri MCA 2997]KAI3596722.1 hypothetical protein WG66_016348 [Moniliophthora roreri]
MAPVLPLELIDAISQFLPSSDLARLSQSCTRYHLVTRRLLYRHLALAPAYNNLGILITLAKKPDIARHVRSFSVELDAGTAVLRPYYRNISIALSFMSELKSLNLSLDPSSTWVLQGVKTHSLTRFSSTFYLDHHVTRFLEHTRSLLELELGSPHATHVSSMPPFAVPHLEQFSGPALAAELIVPGRPVHSIQLTSGDLSENVVQQLAKSSASIAVLSGTSSLPLPRLLNLLSQHIQQLVYLRMMTICNVTEAPDADFYSTIADSLSSLPNLQAFELSGMHWGSLHKSDDGTKQAVWQAKPLSAEFTTDDMFEIEDDSETFFGL